ncbi:MAG TPA: efflux RND transporter periplasmic adaptor subunit [Chloroflexota bacterium]|nr:efflux RND transporter periplasmic adaptor subunit [Chloroflexota bacterium]
MKHRPPLIVRVIVVLVVISVVAYWFVVVRGAEDNGRLTASGTIEATEVVIAPEQGGRVAEVLAATGDNVTAGQPLVRLDTTLLEGQLAQAQAQLAAAQANQAMLVAGPTTAQLAAAEAAVTRAQTQLDAVTEQRDEAETRLADVEEQIADLQSQIAETTAQLQGAQATFQGTGAAEAQTAVTLAQSALAGLNAQLAMAQQLQTVLSSQRQLLNGQITVAESGVDAAQAQLDLLQAGARPEQLDAAQAQVDAAQATVNLLETQIGRQTLIAPIDGVVLARAVEPGEVAAPAATLLVIGELSDLVISVYVPEDRYGQIELGQTAVITADSFPGESFTGTVQRIADKAEFTPRNVQTAEGRASTVFAIELAITDGAGKLKPGMPADVDFGE